MKLLLPIALLVLVLVPIIQWENGCVSGSDSASESVECREEERLALLHIKASIHFPIHSLDGEWEGKECCRWERVTCHPITGHVTQLDLGVSEDHYDYDDWFDYDYDHGGISLNASMFLPLRQLRNLSLSGHGIHNCTDGGGIGRWSNLTKLEILDLSYNSLDGSITYDLASVPSLCTLDLSINNINSSSMPINGFESWSNLTKLQMLDLSYNQLPISIFSSLAKVSSLRALYLDYNDPMGDSTINVKGLETWSNLTKLEILDLSRNFLDGSITYDLAAVPSLHTLDLSGNNINNSNGFESWSNLTKLQMLDLSANDLPISIFSSLVKVSSLRALYLDDNYDMGGNINVPVKELELINELKLEVLSLSGCGLSGSLPDLGHWSYLKALSLKDNYLNDTLSLEVSLHR